MCGEDLNKARSGKRLIYWNQLQAPSGKQKQEPVGTSIEKARAAEGKKKAQKDDTRQAVKTLEVFFQNVTLSEKSTQ